MKITILRGTNQIGGCVTEIESSRGTKIIIDIGENLPAENGRELPELSNIIGMFVNTLALRNTVNHNSSFKDFANNIKTGGLNVFNH